MESRTQYKQMTDVGYISDPDEISKASRSLFQHDGADPFTLWEWSPLPPALSENDLPAGWIQVFNACQIIRIDRHPVESDEDSEWESISDTENWLNWNGD